MVDPILVLLAGLVSLVVGVYGIRDFRRWKLVASTVAQLVAR